MSEVATSRRGRCVSLSAPFQTAEEGLRDRVVPAVCSSAHAWLKKAVFAKTSPCITPILGALIRVDQGLAWSSAAYGFHNDLKNKFSMNRRPDGPANNCARERIEDDRKISPTLPSAGVSDIRSPYLVGPRYAELTLEQVGNQDMRLRRRNVPYAITVQNRSNRASSWARSQTGCSRHA